MVQPLSREAANLLDKPLTQPALVQPAGLNSRP